MLIGENVFVVKNMMLLQIFILMLELFITLLASKNTRRGDYKMQNDVMFTIDQVAQMVGVHKSTLRYWGKIFDIETPRSEGRQRRYPVDQVELLKAIKAHYDAGYSTRGVRMQLGEEKYGTTVF